MSISTEAEQAVTDRPKTFSSNWIRKSLSSYTKSSETRAPN
jgi:hypothetical protein